jgi:hypothetical protein
MQSPKCPNGWRTNGGCDFAADPSLGADRVSVVWLPHINPTTVIVGPAPDEFIEARSISEVTLPLSRLTENGEHWLLDRGCDALPIALIGSGMDTARRVAVVIPLDDSFPARAEAAGRLFNALTGRTPPRTPNALTVQQRRRLGLMLRSLDGWLERCSYRQIAKVLFRPNSIPAGRGWKTHELRGRTIRLCSRGRDLMHGAYLNLLRHPHEFRS